MVARYTTEGMLGQGGMGEVLLATDTRLNRKVTIKPILGSAARSKTPVSRFLTEATFSAKFSETSESCSIASVNVVVSKCVTARLWPQSLQFKYRVDSVTPMPKSCAHTNYSRVSRSCSFSCLLNPRTQRVPAAIACNQSLVC